MWIYEVVKYLYYLSYNYYHYNYYYYSGLMFLVLLLELTDSDSWLGNGGNVAALECTLQQDSRTPTKIPRRR